MAAPTGDEPSPSEAPPSGAGSATLLLIGLGRLLRDEVEAALRPAQLSLRYLSALGHLYREPGLSYSELGRRAGITAQSMQATLQKLEQVGAVERRTLPGRGRTAQLQVTSTGTDLLRRGQQLIRDVEQQLFAEMPTEQQEVLSAQLLETFVAASQTFRSGRFGTGPGGAARGDDPSSGSC